MSKRVTDSSSLRRSELVASQMRQRSSLGAIGIIGWLATVVSLVLLVGIILIGHKKTSVLKNIYAIEYQKRVSEVNAQQQVLKDEADKLKDTLSEAAKAEREESRELYVMKRKLGSAQSQLKNVEIGLRIHRDSFANYRQSLGFPHKSIDEFVKAYQVALSKPEPEPEPRSPVVARSAPAFRAPEQESRSEPDRTSRPEPPKVEEEPYVKPDEMYIDMKVLRAVKRDDANDYDDVRQRVRLTVQVKNGNFNQRYRDVMVYVFVIGEHVTSRNTFKLLEKKQTIFTIEPREEKEVYQAEIQTVYDDDGYKHGFKYDGYVVVFCDQEGKPITSNAVKSTHDSMVDKLIGFDVNTYFNQKGQVITNAHFY